MNEITSVLSFCGLPKELAEKVVSSPLSDELREGLRSSLNSNIIMIVGHRTAEKEYLIAKYAHYAVVNKKRVWYTSGAKLLLFADELHPLFSRADMIVLHTADALSHQDASEIRKLILSYKKIYVLDIINGSPLHTMLKTALNETEYVEVMYGEEN